MPDAELLHDLLDHRADLSPHAPAITAVGQTRSYAELREASLRLAGWLSAQRIGRHDRVVIVLPASVHVSALIYAASRLGAPFCVLHEQVHGPALEHVLDDLKPGLLITADQGAATPARSRGIAVVDATDIAVAAEAATPHDPPRPSPGDIACLIYTSGSTARPKAVVTEHRQLVFVARAIHDRIGYTSGDVVFSPLPLCFDYGLYQLFLAAIGGAHVWLGAATEGGPALLTGLSRAQGTVLAAMPAMAETLLWLLRRSAAPPAALRLITTTGEAMPAHIATELRSVIPGLRVQIMYGLTECKRVAIMPPDEDLRRPGASGLPLTGTEVLVIGPDGEALRPGELGEFVVRGAHVMAGYWRRESLIAERFPSTADGGRELRTGDFGWLDEDGYVYVDGRRDDVYKERGFRVSTAEIEAAAHELPGVRLAVVLPPRASARPHAVLVVVVSGSITPKDVVRDLRSRIEPFKVPRECLVVDKIPLSNNGKIDRRAVAELVGEPHVSIDDTR